MRKKIPIKDRLLNFREISKNNCWIFTGNKNVDGYGRIKIDGQYQSAHRISLQIFKNKNIEDKLVLHKCDNPSCFNPDHLYVGDHDKNMRDKVQRCRVKGKAHPQALNITEDIKKAIQCLRNNGFSQQKIGDLLGLHQGRISEILMNKHWSTR